MKPSERAVADAIVRREAPWMIEQAEHHLKEFARAGVSGRSGNPASAAVDRRDFLACSLCGEFVVNGWLEPVGRPLCEHAAVWVRMLDRRAEDQL